MHLHGCMLELSTTCHTDDQQAAILSNIMLNAQHGKLHAPSCSPLGGSPDHQTCLSLTAARTTQPYISECIRLLMALGTAASIAQLMQCCLLQRWQQDAAASLLAQWYATAISPTKSQSKGNQAATRSTQMLLPQLSTSKKIRKAKATFIKQP